MKNNDNNQGVTETPSYIIIRVDNNSKLIMSYKNGMEFMRIWSGSTELFQEYTHHDVEVKLVDKEFEIKFISEQQFKEIKMAAVIGATPED